MTATLILPETSKKLPEKLEQTQPKNVISLEEFLVNPPERMEWVDGNLVDKTGMTFKHGLAQAKLARYWGIHKDSSGQGGEVVTETLCRTAKQGRRPDVAYITPELLPPSGNFTSFPQSFPLIAEVASPEDSAEELFAKAQEYLESGCQEVWLLFPEARLVFVNASQGWRLFNANEVVNTQTILAGFSIPVGELLV
ncbi:MULTISPECIES: Uma2 family endonuclease [unclassified Microcoleus]|uniref:Uma2 family endonuclease n=1 Tax=unclassified Microcoleus TaxID=2642155 RepID=UPI002FD5B40E